MPLNILLPSIIVLFATIFAYRSLRRKSLGGYTETFENVFLEIKVPKELDVEHIDLQTAPIASEHMFASLHGLLKVTPKEQEHFSFEIISSPKGIKFYAVVPKSIHSYVESQIYAQYPRAVIFEVPDYIESVDRTGKVVLGTDVRLSKDYYFPIKTFKDFEVDPISAITSALSEVKEDEQVWLQLLVRPIPDVWQEEGYKYVTDVREGTIKRAGGSLVSTLGKELSELFFNVIKRISTPPEVTAFPARTAAALPPRLSPGQELEIKAIENKLTKMGFECVIRVLAIADSTEVAKLRLRSVIASLKQFSTANLNSFIASGDYDDSREFFDAYRLRKFSEDGSYIFNTEELGSIYHLPAAGVETPLISWSYAKRSEPPLNIPTEGSTLFGITTYRNKEVKFGIKDEDRRRHVYAIGKTGSGKSQLFRNMIIQDMRNGKGVGVLDPHGTLIDELLEAIPDDRVKDVVYFDPSDSERPPALNMLEVLDPDQKNLMASGIVSAIKQHFGFSWGPRLEYLLNICILTLLEVEGTTLLGLTRLLMDDNYRKFITYYVKDPVIKDFWAKEFKEMKGNQKLLTEAVAPIQNKIGRFLSSSTIRNILGRAKSTVRIDEIMNTGKIFLINLSIGKIGEDNANLLGSLLVSRMQFVALQRARIPEAERRDFYLFVDEFQNFASGGFESILSEARKYRLSLHLTHQYTLQLPEEILNAVFGNVGTIISFAVGAPDAEILAKEFAPVFDENDLISLERQHMYLKLMIEGQTSKPFSALSMPRITDLTNNGAKAKELSRETYGQDRQYVEERIRQWVERKFDLGMAIAEENRVKEGSVTGDQGSLPLKRQEGPSFDGKIEGEVVLGSRGE